MRTRVDRRTRLVLALGVGLTLAGPLAALPSAHAASFRLQDVGIGHVWTIMLENSDFLVTFGGGRATNPYIASTLQAMGALIPNYYGTGHNSLDNYLTMISGQAPNESTKGDCTDASILGGARGLTQDANGQWLLPRSTGPTAGLDPQTGIAPPDTTADGCTYPAYVPTLPDQFDAKGVSWKAYMEDMEVRPSQRPTTCAYAGAPAATPGDTSHDATYDLWARKHDPFLYFHSITDRKAYCAAHDVPEGPTTPDPNDPANSPLASDLQSVSTTPQYSFLTPNLCDDAHDGNSVQACSDGGAGGLPRADQWAKKYVPLILNSPAFKKDGLLILTVDEGSEALACCGEPKSRNLPLTIDNGSFSNGDVGTTAGRGGGQIGTVMISPFIKPGTVDTTGTYNHDSYLRSMEDIYGIGATTAIPGSDGQGHLGYAGTLPADATAQNPTGTPVASYGPDIFNAVGTPASSLPEAHLPLVLPVVGLGILAVTLRRRRRISGT